MASFSLFLSFKNSKQKFADDWFRTADLWCRKQPFYQLSHNPYQTSGITYLRGAEYLELWRWAIFEILHCTISDHEWSIRLCEDSPHSALLFKKLPSP